MITKTDSAKAEKAGRNARSRKCSAASTALSEAGFWFVQWLLVFCDVVMVYCAISAAELRLTGILDAGLWGRLYRAIIASALVWAMWIKVERRWKR